MPIDAAWREKSLRDREGKALTFAPLRIVHDMPERPMRVSAGTLTPLSAPGLNAPQLRGLSIESAYDALQPLRDLTPSGTYMLTIQTRSLIEVEVDGVIESTSELPPGRYNLRDLTSKAGMSAIKVYVTDRTGRRQVTAFPVYRSELMRERAIREFSLAVGAPVESDTSSIGVAGFYRANLSPRVLLDAGLSSYRGNVAVQGEATTPLTNGVARARLGVSRFGNDLGVNASVSASKLLGANRIGREIDRRFWSGPKTVSGIVGVSTGRFSGDPFAYASQPSNYFYAGSTISRSWDRAAWQASATGLVPSRGPAALGLTLGGARRFGVLGIGLQSSVRFEGGKTTTTVSYTLSVSRRSEFRFHQLSITPDEVRGQWNGPPLRSGFGIIGSSVNAYADRAGYGVAARATANTNRFTATTDQILTDGEGGRRSETRATLATGIAFADGAVAVGRPLGNGAFAIVRRAPSLKGAKVSIGQEDPTKKSLRPHTGWFGPTAVGLQPYVDASLEVDVSGAAEGYALGELNTYMRPSYGAGYKIRVGADNWRSAIGTLVTANGPVASVRLTITPLTGGKTAQPTTAFTNPTGRFYVENLAEASYAIEVAGERVATFTIPKGAGAVTDLGTLTAKPR